jgi:hypothetical protein
MNRNRHGAKRRRQRIRLWDYAQARGVLPYVSSIMASIREHWLEAVGHDLRVRRLVARPGRPDRDRLIAHSEAVDGGRRASEKLQAALEELQALDIYCVDPVQGEALIPFKHSNQLAWFVYNQFERDAIRFWRYHEDSLEMRRPLVEALTGEEEPDESA